MRVRLSVNKLFMQGYLNIDPNPIPYEDLGSEPHNLNSVFDLLDDRECDEILCDGSLSYIAYQNLGNFLSGLLSKIKKNGKLIIVDTDLTKVVQMYHTGEIDIDTFNYLVFGDQTHPSQIKRSGFSISELIEFLAGYKVNKKMIDGHTFVLEVINV